MAVTITFQEKPGRTLTAKIVRRNNDAAEVAADTVAERENADGIYVATFNADPSSGDYTLHSYTGGQLTGTGVVFGIDGAGAYYEQSLSQAAAGEGGASGPVTVEGFSNAAMQQIAGLRVTLKSPTLIGKKFDPPVIRGRDYSASDSNSIDIDVEGWVDFSGASVVLSGVLRDSKGTVVSALNWTGSIVNGGEETQILRFQPTAAQTAIPAGHYECEAVVTLAGSGRKVSPAGVFILPLIGAGV